MPDKFDILVRDLGRVRASGSTFGVFGENGHDYELNPTLCEQELTECEAVHGILLPADYRQFLLRVGNGGAGPYYGLFPFGEMDDGFELGPWGDFIGQLSAQFPHSDAWNDLTGKPDNSEPMDSDKYDELLDDFEKRYFHTSQVNGAIPICHLGCALRQWLVITGREAGNVWCDDRADYKGLYPLKSHNRRRTTFFEWYRDWLDEVLAKVQLWEKRSTER